MVLEGTIGINKIATSLEIYFNSIFLWSTSVIFYLAPIRKHRWGHGELEMMQVVEVPPACGPTAAPRGFEQPRVGRYGGCCSGTSCLQDFSVRKKSS